MNKEGVFRSLVAQLQEDSNVLALLLGGSRGKGKEFVKESSDYDLYLITKNNSANKYRKRLASLNNQDFDFNVLSISEFKKETEEWKRYSYAHIALIFDKTRKMKRLVEEKSKIPVKNIKKHVSGHLDGYINYVYRSLKCWRDNQELGARLEADKSIDIFWNVIFALDGRRPVPYYKYLEWDLKNYPLANIDMSTTELLRIVRKIIDKADIEAQKELFRALEKVARKEGYGKVFDNWGYKIDFIKNFR